MSTEQCQLQETWSRPQSLQAGILQLEMDHRNRCSVYVMVLEEVVTFAKGQGDYCSLDMLNKSLLSSSWVDQFKETRLSLSVAVWSSLVPGDLHGLTRQLSHTTPLEQLYDRFSKQWPFLKTMSDSSLTVSSSFTFLNDFNSAWSASWCSIGRLSILCHCWLRTNQETHGGSYHALLQAELRPRS